MRIFLSGLMGSGKTTVAKALARRLQLPHFDSDELIALEAQKPVADLFRDSGEDAFRRLELDVVERLLHTQERCVVALGGGAVTQRPLRRLLLRSGFVVTLDAPTEVLASRVGGGDGRPLLAGQDIRARLEALRSVRGPAYAECHLRLDTRDCEPDVLAQRIERAARLTPIVVPLGTRTYCVHVGAGNRSELAHYVDELAPVSSVLVVSDTEVGPRWARALSESLRASGLPVSEILLAPGEAAKTLASVERIWTSALEAGLDRGSLLIGVGGGVIGDLTGFAAATLLRGVRLGHVATTLLAMVDSAIGGKTGFDTQHGKNLIGAFHQPRFVLSDVEVLATLPEAERRSGLAEVVKSAWIAGESAVAQLEADAQALSDGEPAATVRAIRMAAALKAHVVTEDEREDGLRAVLNLGHTLAHAIEAASGYAGIRHGEAVSIGMVAAIRLARALGRAETAEVERLRGLLERLSLPTEVERGLDERVLSFLGSDKKRKGKTLHYVVPGKPGDVRVVPLAMDEVVRLLRAT
jgi:shikimate kinase / 3-dehydroquinate synthase